MTKRNKEFNAGWRVFLHYFVTQSGRKIPFYLGVGKYIPYCHKPRLKNQLWCKMLQEAEDKGWTWHAAIVEDFGVKIENGNRPWERAKKLRDETAKMYAADGHKLANLYEGCQVSTPSFDIVNEILNQKFEDYNAEEKEFINTPLRGTYDR